MSKFSFDLSKFKKSHSDANSTVLKHADGHELRVDHKKLPKALKSQLDKLEIAPQKMADGGFPNPQPNPAPEETPEAQPQQPVAQAPSQPLDIEQVEPPTAPTPTPEPEEEPAPKEAPAAAPKAVETPKDEILTSSLKKMRHWRTTSIKGTFNRKPTRICSQTKAHLERLGLSLVL